MAALRRQWHSQAVLGVLCATLLAAAALGARAYDDGDLFAGPHEVHRDYAASVVATGTGLTQNLFVNSVPITNLGTVTKVMAHLPMALNGHARTALDICFGMGTTFRSLTSWNVDTTAVDLSSAVVQSFSFFHKDGSRVLSRRNAHIVVDDGRRYLLRTTRMFDVITIDPPPPVEAAGSSLLYSQEFYALAKQRLRRGGILQQWIPLTHGATLSSVALALTGSFRHVLAYRAPGMGTYFIASMTPVKVPSARVFIERLPQSAREDLLEWESGRTIDSVVSRILRSEIPLSSVLTRSGSDIPPVSDDRPFNEFYFLRAGESV